MRFSVNFESQNAKKNSLWIADKNKSDGFSGRCTVPGFSHETGIWRPNFLVDVIDERNFTKEQLKDPEKLILLAKVVMSDFDTSDIETEVASKVAKKVRTKLSTSSKTKLSSQPKARVRNLSDFFDD